MINPNKPQEKQYCDIILAGIMAICKFSNKNTSFGFSSWLRSACRGLWFDV